MGRGGVAVWCSGMVCTLQPKGLRFESASSHCVATMDKLLTHVVCAEGNRRLPHSSHPPGANEPAFWQRSIITTTQVQIPQMNPFIL